MTHRPVPAAPARPRRLHLTVAAPVGRALVPYVRRHLRAAHAILNPPLAELSLALVGDPAMSALHEQYLGIAGPTDVLTFPLDENHGGEVSAGEVVVCVPEARRRAKAEGTDLRREVLLYALHGLLHLCGYDDRTDRQFARMHRTEDAILTQLGVGAVYRPKSAQRTEKPVSKLKSRSSRAVATPAAELTGANSSVVRPAKVAQVKRRPPGRKISRGSTTNVRRRLGGG